MAINSGKHFSVGLMTCSMLYLYVPIIIFVVGWSKPVFAVFAVVAIAISLALFAKSVDYTSDFKTISSKTIASVALISVITGVIAGWGGFMPQSYDWNKHNAVFRDLITKQWPVMYENNGVQSMLTYYLAQYLVPATIGKISLVVFQLDTGIGFIIGEICMLLWNSFGLSLVLLNTIQYLQSQKQPFKTCFYFIMFGSLLALGRYVLSLITGANLSIFSQGYQHNLSTDYIGAQYTTNFVQLRWVFPQCIATWLTMSIFLQRKVKTNNYVVLGMPLLLFSCFPFLGLLPFLLADSVRELLANKSIVKWIKNCFSIQNVLVIFSVGTFSVLYLLGYILAEKPSVFHFRINYFTVPAYLVFVLFTFGIYMIILIPAVRRCIAVDKLYFILSGIVLLILPLFRMGMANDFTMRVSIPALYVLCCYYIQALLNEKVQLNVPYYLILLVGFLVGMIYPAMEMEEIIHQKFVLKTQSLADEYGSLEYYANPDLKNIDFERFCLNNGYIDILYNYYSYGDSADLFMDTIGKNH